MNKNLEYMRHHSIRFGTFVAQIDAKLFMGAPGQIAEFRVYRLYGDVNRLDELKGAIKALLDENNAPECRIVVTL